MSPTPKIQNPKIFMSPTPPLFRGQNHQNRPEGGGRRVGIILISVIPLSFCGRRPRRNLPSGPWGLICAQGYWNVALNLLRGKLYHFGIDCAGKLKKYCTVLWKNECEICYWKSIVLCSAKWNHTVKSAMCWEIEIQLLSILFWKIEILL